MFARKDKVDRGGGFALKNKNHQSTTTYSIKTISCIVISHVNVLNKNKSVRIIKLINLHYITIDEEKGNDNQNALDENI